MGLDTVELVIAIESTFDLVIPDDRAEKIVTIGDAYRFVLKRLEFPESPGPCLSAGAFYRLRRTMMKLVGTPAPRSVRRPGWTRCWSIPTGAGPGRLGESLGWRLPPLQRPAWVATTSGLAALALSRISRGRAAHPEFPGAAAGPLPPLPPGDLSASASPRRTPHVRSRPAFPRNARPVRGLIATITTTNYAALAHRRGGWDRREVRDVLFRLVAEQAGVPAERLTEDTRFVADLGMD